MVDKVRDVLSMSLPDVLKVVAYIAVILLSFFVVQTTAMTNKEDIKEIRDVEIKELVENDKELDKKIVAIEKSNIERRGEFNMILSDLARHEEQWKKIEYHLDRLDPAGTEDR